MKKHFLLSFVIVALFLGPLPLFANTRHALIIGNNRYWNLEQLPKAIPDMNAVARTLRRLGYETVEKSDLNRREMQNEIQNFMQRLAANPNNEGFFWYGGHGVEINRESFLVPIDIDARSEADVEHFSISLSWIMRNFETTARNRVNVVVLDACRDPPFRNMPATRGGGTTRRMGLVEHPPQDLFIIYSTSPGTTAMDGADSDTNSPFTTAFLRYAEVPDPLTSIMSDIYRETMRLTNGQQRPAQGGSIMSIRDYRLNRSGGGASPSPPPTPPPVFGNLRLTSEVSGVLLINGNVYTNRITAFQVANISGIPVGSSRIGVRADDGKDHVKDVMITANNFAELYISRPTPPPQLRPQQPQSNTSSRTTTANDVFNTINRGIDTAQRVHGFGRAIGLW